MAERNQQSDYRQNQRAGYDLDDRFDQESGYRGGRSESEWGRSELGRPWGQESDYRNESRQRDRAGQFGSQQRDGGMRGEEQQWRDSGQNPARQYRGESRDQSHGHWPDEQDWHDDDPYGHAHEHHYDRPNERQDMRNGPDYAPYDSQSRDRGQSPDYGRSSPDYGRQSSRGGQAWQQQFGQQPRPGNTGDRRSNFGYEGGPGFQSRQEERYGGYYGESSGLADQRRWPADGPHAGKGPKDYRRSDDAIRNDVCEMLTQHGHIDATDINVSVHNGEVTLSGNVPDKHMRREVEDALDELSGVRDVNNQLRIDNRPAYDVLKREEPAKDSQHDNQREDAQTAKSRE